MYSYVTLKQATTVLYVWIDTEMYNSIALTASKTLTLLNTNPFNDV